MLSVRNLTVRYKNITALCDINLYVDERDRLGIVGQSGSGKTTLIKVISGIEKNYIGSIEWDKKRNIQIVFQDPSSSLNPRMKIFNIVVEPLLIKGFDKKKIIEMFERVMIEVGLDPSLGEKYPHHLSGGQKQRVSIARAIILEPDILICDEPLSSLDVSLSAQIMNLINNLFKKHNFSLIFVSHDISSVYYLTERIIVLLKGEIVEYGRTVDVIEKPMHPYTKLLLSSVLDLEKNRSDFFCQKTSEKNITSACPFSDVCVYITGECSLYEHRFFDCGGGHFTKCIRFSDIGAYEKIYY